MRTLYNLISPNSGKLLAQCSSFDAALREAEWRGDAVIDGRPATYQVAKLEREPSFDYSIGAPHRHGSAWPEAKVRELARTMVDSLTGALKSDWHFEIDTKVTPKEPARLDYRD